MLMVNHEYQDDDVIVIDDLSKCYGRHQALHPLQLTVKVGECLALIGHNGAGKTTLLKLLLGLTRPDTGSIHLWGEAQSGDGGVQTRHGIGFLPEAVNFKEQLTGIEALRFYAGLKNVPVGECYRLLEQVELEEVAGQRISTYSKGMRQRLGLAQALLGEPRLLVLDEPTSGLDPFFRRKFYRIIRDQQGRGCTVILSSHSLTEIEAQTDRIAIMKDGRLVTQGSMEELRQQAELAVSIKVTLRDKASDGLNSLLGNKFECAELSDLVYIVKCSKTEKMELLRQITSWEMELVEDVDIIPADLNDLFIHFAGTEVLL